MPSVSPADLFRAMADRIEKNDAAEFAGAILIVPPSSRDGRGDETIDLLLVDPARDIVNFWSTLRAKTERAASQAIQFAEQQQQITQGGWR